MVFVDIKITDSYWETLEVNKEDIEFIYAYLLEKETPLPSKKLSEALIVERLQKESEALKEKQRQNGEIYLPKLEFSIGDKIQFPALNWVSGNVGDIRTGNNPEYPQLKVMTVDLENGQQRQFASNLEEHSLNKDASITKDTVTDDLGAILENFGDEITHKLEKKLDENKDLVRIGEDWFPKSLLIDFNVGHLNLAEAVLDMNEGGPLPVDTLLEQIDIQSDDPEELVRFSLNYALQQDPRFDDVGASGNVEWFLNRLEPENVREKPLQLKYEPLAYDRSLLTEDMLKVEQRLDDELVEPVAAYLQKIPKKEVSLVLTYPHWRVGSIPLTPFTRPFFPTALESPRVKVTLIDAQGEQISAWVVRPFNYVYGLRKWYEELELIPGSIIKIKQGKKPGEVFIEAEKRRSNREYIRTLLIGADGGVVFAMLKQTITADFNERMVIALPSTAVLDELWEKRSNNPWAIKDVVINTMKELGKLNPQGNVHAVELYAAVNCIRRCPPGVIFSMLTTDPVFTAVGDLYFHLSENS
jgi:hypothetical protein